MDIIIRVSSIAGRSRIIAKHNDTFASLKKEIGVQFKVPNEEISLCFDGPGNQCIAGDARTLSSLGIKSGSVLHLTSKTAPLVEGIDITPAKHLTTSDLPTKPPLEGQQAGGTTSTKSDAQSSSGGAAKLQPSNNSSNDANTNEDPKKVTFLSFDSFLKRRNYLTSDLPGYISYSPISLEIGRMNKLPPSVTLKHQAYRHVDHLEFMNLSEINDFVRYWRDDLAMLTPRIGWMYGYYKEDSHYALGYRAVMEGIYEPPQMCIDGQVQLLNDVFLKKLDAIFSNLNLERIGIIMTSLPKEGSLTSIEALQITKHQLEFCTDKHYTSYPLVNKFVTCTITPCSESGGEPVPHAFMISDMGMAFVRDGILDESPPDLTHLKVKDSRKGELYPQILESGRPTTKFDVDWFVVKVNNSAPKRVRSRFRFAKFPRENRRTPIPSGAISAYMKDVAKKTMTSWDKFADFHLIIHIAKALDPDTAIAVCSTIESETAVDSALEELLTSL